MIIDEIKKVAKVGVRIPKPKEDSDYRVKEWVQGVEGREVLRYSFPTRSNPNKLYTKPITEGELTASYNKLIDTGELRTKWYKQKFSDIYCKHPCNFTTIGGVFVLIRKAKYVKRGLYEKIIKDE